MGPVSTIITHNTGVITPEVVNGYDAAREARTIVHTILGRPDPDITLRPAGLRSGTLTLVFATGAAAASAEAALLFPQVLVLSDPDVPQVAMSFVVGPEGQASTRSLDLDTQTVWLLELPFQEVTV